MKRDEFSSSHLSHSEIDLKANGKLFDCRKTPLITKRFLLDIFHIHFTYNISNLSRVKYLIAFFHVFPLKIVLSLIQKIFQGSNKYLSNNNPDNNRCISRGRVWDNMEMDVAGIFFSKHDFWMGKYFISFFFFNIFH